MPFRTFRGTALFINSPYFSVTLSVTSDAAILLLHLLRAYTGQTIGVKKTPKLTTDMESGCAIP